MTDTSDKRTKDIRYDPATWKHGWAASAIIRDLFTKIDEQAEEIERLRENTGVDKRIQGQADEVVRQRTAIRQAMRALVSIEQENYAIECPSYEINIAIKALGEVYGE